MIREELKQLATTPRDLRKFGLTVGAVFVLLGAWFLYRHKPAWPYTLPPGIALLTLGLVAPRSLKPIYIGWMAMAIALGLAMSTVVLTVFFYLVVTPTGLAARLAGKDFLSLKLDRRAQSYWIKKAPTPHKQAADYEQQY
jgi:hypothetical protein